MDSQYSRLMTYLGVTLSPRDFVPFRHCIETITELRDQRKIVRPLPKIVLDGNKVSFLFGTVSKLKVYRKLAKRYPGLVVGENDPSEDTYVNCCYQKLYSCFGLPWFDVPEVPTLHDVMSDFLLKASQLGYHESFSVPEVELNDHTLHFKSSSAAGSSWKISDLLDLLYMEYSRGPLLLVMGGFNFDFFSNYSGYRNADLLVMYALYPECWDNSRMIFTDKLERLVEKKPLSPEERIIFYKKNLVFLKNNNKLMYHNFMTMLRQQDNLNFPEMSLMDEKPKLIKKASLNFQPSSVTDAKPGKEPEGKAEDEVSAVRDPEVKAKDYKPVANLAGLTAISKISVLDLSAFYSSDSETSEISEQDIEPEDSVSVVEGVSEGEEKTKNSPKGGKKKEKISNTQILKNPEPTYFDCDSDSSDGSYDMSYELRDLVLSFPELIKHKERSPQVKQKQNPNFTEDVLMYTGDHQTERVLWDQGYPGMDKFDNEVTGKTETIKPKFEFPDVSDQILAFNKPRKNEVSSLFSSPSQKFSEPSNISTPSATISKRKRNCRSPEGMSDAERWDEESERWQEQSSIHDNEEQATTVNDSPKVIEELSDRLTALVISKPIDDFDVDEEFLFKNFFDAQKPLRVGLNDDYDTNETVKVRNLPEPKKKDISQKKQDKYATLKPTLTYERMLEITSALEMDVAEYSKNIPSHSRSSKSKTKSKAKSDSSRYSGNLPPVAVKRIHLPEINSYISENLDRKIRSRKAKYNETAFEKFDNSCYAYSLFKLLKPFNISCPDLFNTGDHEEFMVYWSQLCTDLKLTEFGVLLVNYAFCSSCWRLSQSLSYEFFRNLQVTYYVTSQRDCPRCKEITDHIEYNHFIHSELAMFIDTRVHKVLMSGESIGYYLTPPGKNLGGLDYVTYDRGHTGHWQVGDGNFAVLSLISGKLPEPFFECTTGRKPSAVVAQLDYKLPEPPTIAEARARKTASALTSGSRPKQKTPLFNN